MYMVMFVLSDPTMLDDVLDAWEKCGVGGVTILECMGIHKRRRLGGHLPLRYGFEQLAASCAEGHYALLTMVDKEEIVQCCLASAEAIVGDLSSPNTGVFAAWPLSLVKGTTKAPDKE